MENKQLDTKDLLMNKKEELIWRVIDNVISCCAVTRIDGAKSIGVVGDRIIART